jgi:hypothetical protein
VILHAASFVFDEKRLVGAGKIPAVVVAASRTLCRLPKLHDATSVIHGASPVVGLSSRLHWLTASVEVQDSNPRPDRYERSALPN